MLGAYTWTMGYTFKTYQTPNNFGPMSMDANKQPIPVAAGVQTQDDTGTPVTSPLAVPSASTTTIVVPRNASIFHIRPLANTVNVSEVSDMATYLTVPTGAEQLIPCTRMSRIYLKANTGDATGTTFWFEMI